MIRPVWILIVVAALFPGAALARDDASSVFDRLPPNGKQMVLDEALALNIISEHVRAANDIAKQMLAEVGNPTTASALNDDAQLFSTEAATAWLDCELLDGGLETHVSDAAFNRMRDKAAKLFKLSNQVSTKQDLFDLRLMLNTLNSTVRNDVWAFKAKWGVDYECALGKQACSAAQ